MALCAESNLIEFRFGLSLCQQAALGVTCSASYLIRHFGLPDLGSLGEAAAAGAVDRH